MITLFINNVLIILFCFWQQKCFQVDPLDFEDYITKNQTVFLNDPQRELLLYPSDDVSVSL